MMPATPAMVWVAFLTKRETTFFDDLASPFVSVDDRLSSAPRASLALTGLMVNWDR